MDLKAWNFLKSLDKYLHYFTDSTYVSFKKITFNNFLFLITRLEKSSIILLIN